MRPERDSCIQVHPGEGRIRSDRCSEERLGAPLRSARVVCARGESAPIAAGKKGWERR